MTAVYYTAYPRRRKLGGAPLMQPLDKLAQTNVNCQEEGTGGSSNTGMAVDSLIVY